MVKKLSSRALEKPFNYSGNLGVSGRVTTTSLQSNVSFNTSNTLSIVAGAVTLDLSTTNHFLVSLTSSISSMTFSNPPAAGIFYIFLLKVTADGTARTITWPGTVRWANNIPPVLTSTLNKVDTFVFYTEDGGSNYYGFITGQNS